MFVSLNSCILIRFAQHPLNLLANYLKEQKSFFTFSDVQFA
jgi:hypothetical protein